MSEKRFLGWEPAEFHEYVFDDDGRQVGVLVTREPEWDNLEADKMLGLAEYEAGVCSCGFHHSQRDPEKHFYTWDSETCPMCAAAAKRSRDDEAADNKARKDAGDTTPASLPSDGRKTYLRLMTPDEVEERRSGPQRVRREVRRPSETGRD